MVGYMEIIDGKEGCTECKGEPLKQSGFGWYRCSTCGGGWGTPPDPRPISCHSCNGSGRIRTGRAQSGTCGLCGGTGRIEPSPEPNRAQEPQQESEVVGVKGWGFYNPEGSPEMLFLAANEPEAWAKMAQRIAPIATAGMKEAGWQMRPMHAYPALPDGTGPVATIKAHAAELERLNGIHCRAALAASQWRDDARLKMAQKDATIARLQADYNEATALLEQARQSLYDYWASGCSGEPTRTLIAAIDKYLGTDSEGEVD